MRVLPEFIVAEVEGGPRLKAMLPSLLERGELHSQLQLFDTVSERKLRCARTHAKCRPNVYRGAVSTIGLLPGDAVMVRIGC